MQSPDTPTFGPDGDFYVINHTDSSSSILRFSATGTPLGTFVSDLANGLNRANGFTFGLDGNLYVSSENTGSVLRYNGTTGAFIDTFVAPNSGGLSEPGDLMFGTDKNLYVYDTSGRAPTGGFVFRYDGQTGALLNSFNADAGSFAISDAQMIPLSVPEPSSYVLLFLGAVSLLSFRLLARFHALSRGSRLARG